MLTDEQVWNLRGRKVEIELDDGNKGRKKSTSGHLVTRDPESKSIVLAQFSENELSEISKFEWIPSCSVKSINQLDENPDDVEQIQNQIQKFLNGRNEGVESEEDIQKRAHRIVDYLKSHHLKVAEKPPGVFVIDGVVRFEPPYQLDNFYCDIPIVLKNILKLVQKIE